MKKTLLILGLISFSNFILAQGFKNENAKIGISTGTYLNVTGGTNGGITNNSNGEITNNGIITLTGNFINNADFVSGINSKVKMQGAYQDIGGSNTTTFCDLFIDGTDNKTISIKTNINDSLIFNNNNIAISNNNLVLLINAIIYNNSPTKFVVTNGTGKLVKNSLSTGTDFLFPVGDTLNSYKPVKLNYAGTIDTFGVRIIKGINPSTGVDDECVQYTYIVEESNNGGSSGSLNLGWNTADEGSSFDRTQAMIEHYINTSWNLENGVPGASSNLPFTDWYYENQSNSITDFSSNASRFIVTSATSLTVVASASPNSICLGDSTSLLASVFGGTPTYTYLWSPTTGLSDSTIANPMASPSIITTYTVTVTDSIGGTDVDSVIVGINPNPVAYAGEDTSVCQSNSIDLTATGGTSYLWSTGGTTATITVNPVTDTTFTVTVTNSFGCTDTDDVIVTIYPNPVAYAGEDTSVCQSNSIDLTATGGTFYLWSTTETTATITVTPTITTTYIVTVTDGNGCTDTDDVIVTVNLSYFYTDNEGICDGETYTWHGNDYTTADTYYDSLTTTNGCDSIYELSLTVNPNPTVYLGSDTSTCQGNTITLDAGAGYTYLWNDATTNQTLDVTVTGNYSVTITDGNGCMDSDTINITVYPVPNILTDKTDETCAGANNGSVDLTVTGTSPFVFNWNNGETTEDISNLEPNTYIVTVTDSNGCSATENIDILYSEILCPDLYVPNIFSPNHDNHNDELFVRGTGIKSLTFIVYDRWGEKIFETTNKDNGWDGTYKGKLLDNAVFIYYLKAEMINNETVERKGTVTLAK